MLAHFRVLLRVVDNALVESSFSRLGFVLHGVFVFRF